MMKNKIFISTLFITALVPISALLAASALPSDSLFNLQWALSNNGSQLVDHNLDDSHTLSSPGKSGVDIGWMTAQKDFALATHPVTVAVIDYGADMTHPELQGRIQTGAWDFITNMALSGDPEGHGTHVSGIIAANCNNNVGICGVAPASVKILPLKILDPNFQNFVLKGTSKSLADFATDAINYAVKNKVDVINLSLGWPKIIENANSVAAIQSAISAGIVVVVAAGNDRKDHPTYPCSELGVICVGAISNNGNISDYSNYGGNVHVLAPGDSIVSTYPMVLNSQTLGITGFEYLTGTSQASPQVAGIAATLKSIYPNMSANEITARIFASAAPPPTPGAAQYGLVNLPAAIHATKKPIYQANFLDIDNTNLDEVSLVAKGQLSIKNLWADAAKFTATISVNGKSAGQISLAKFLGNGNSIQIPWSYQFNSLDESSILPLILTLTDASGTHKQISASITVSRSTLNISGQQVISFPNSVKPNDVFATNAIKKTSSKLLSVTSYGQAAYGNVDGHPVYYKMLGNSNDVISVQIFDSKNLSQASVLQIPGISQLAHVERVDILGNGNLDWVIIGVGKMVAGSQVGAEYIQFYFFDAQFKPLFGNSSAWQVIPENTAQAYAMIKNFDDPHSWIRGAQGVLLPSFMTYSTLPSADNFSSLDARSLNNSNHVYYLNPTNFDLQNVAKTATPISLQVRALDNALFYNDLNANFFKKFPQLQSGGSPDYYVINALPQTEANMKAGHVRYVMADRDTSDSDLFVLDITDTTHFSLSLLAQNWHLFDMCGLMINEPSQTRCISRIPITAPSGSNVGGSMAYLQFYTSSRGGMTWVDEQNNLTAETVFDFTQVDDPVTAVQNAFDIPSLGKFFFLQTQFDLVSYLQKPDGSAALIAKFPLERETSNFNSNQFSETFNPVILGTANLPLPGLYVDSTLVRGNLVSVLLWSPQNNTLSKPVRYSLSVPANCLNMSPVNLNQQSQSFAIPFLCSENGRVTLHLLQPQK